MDQQIFANALAQAMPSVEDQLAQILLEQALAPYPRLQSYGFEAGYGPPDGGVGYLEFFPPDEFFNPNPGVPYIEVYDREMQGDELQRMLFGDALHYLPQVDPLFADVREMYWQSRTPEQQTIDQNAYQRAQAEYGENRPYDQWADVSRKDAHLRGYLAPDNRDEWRGSYTPEQVQLLEQMRAYLMGQ